MSSELHWGGINFKSLCKAVFPDLWMMIAVMIIAYLGLGIAANMRDTSSYTSSTVAAVYPFNQMYTLEASSDALEMVSSVNEVLNSEMFRTGLKDRIAEPADFSLYSQQIENTYILMLSVTGSSPENAYRTLRTALDYYEEISSHLVGEGHLEILTEPDFPLAADNDSGILNRRFLLTVFAGFAMGALLVLRYAMRKTYKTASAIQKYYQNVRFFRITDSASDKKIRRNNRKNNSGSVTKQETVRITALELMQVMRAKNARSIFITSAAHGEGKTEIADLLRIELEKSGKSGIILDTGSNHAQEDFSDITNDIKEMIRRAEEIADVVLIDGCLWTGFGDELIWKEAADTSLVVCRQDKADFFAIDRMMTDLSESNSDFLGCVLYGF